MGLEGKDMALLLGMLGGSALGGLTAPQGQKLQSFEGFDGIDPAEMLGESKNYITNSLDAAIEKANEPVTLRTTVNPLPAFVGGGLPFAIAAPGQDATRLNPALRTTPGSTIARRRLDGGSGGGTGGGPSLITTPNQGTVLSNDGKTPAGGDAVLGGGRGANGLIGRPTINTPPFSVPGSVSEEEAASNVTDEQAMAAAQLLQKLQGSLHA